MIPVILAAAINSDQNDVQLKINSEVQMQKAPNKHKIAVSKFLRGTAQAKVATPKSRETARTTYLARGLRSCAGMPTP
eukprot:2056995-Alexandrium_andersonii.AAC.1